MIKITKSLEPNSHCQFQHQIQLQQLKFQKTNSPHQEFRYRICLDIGADVRRPFRCVHLGLSGQNFQITHKYIKKLMLEVKSHFKVA